MAQNFDYVYWKTSKKNTQNEKGIFPTTELGQLLTKNPRTTTCKLTPSLTNVPRDSNDAAPAITKGMLKEMSDSILWDTNNLFDKFESSFKSLLASQSEPNGWMNSMKEVTTSHVSHIEAVESALTRLRDDNTRLKAKVSDLDFLSILRGRRKGGSWLILLPKLCPTRLANTKPKPFTLLRFGLGNSFLTLVKMLFWDREIHSFHSFST